MADDIAEILDHMQVESAAIYGVSFGGVIVQEFAARHPGRVDRLILVGTYSDSRPTTPGKLLWLLSIYAGAFSNFAPRRVLSWGMSLAYRHWPSAADYLSEAVLDLRHLDAFTTRWSINLVNYLRVLDRGRYPILAVVGESSWPRSITFMNELCAAVPRTQLIRVPDSTDPTPLCRPAEFNAILGGFLSEK